MRIQPRRAMVIALVVLMAAGAAWGAGARPAAAAVPVPTVVPSSTPAAAMDAPDPDVVVVGSTYYAYTTGTTWGNHIGVLRSSSPNMGFATITGKSYGSTAIGTLPGWEQPDTQTSPGVFDYAGHFVMFYDAVDTANGHYCISVATAASPTGPFQDSSSGPVICQTDLGGSVDPQPFVDPATGQAWLDWKSNDGSSGQPAYLWAARLGGDGTTFSSYPVRLLAQDSVDFPWETTVENPDMVDVGGTYYLFFSAGRYDSSGYGEAYAVCSGAAGPCSQPRSGELLTSYGQVAGPGAGNVFTDTAGQAWMSYAAWTSGCTSYSCGGERRLYVGRTSFTAPTSGPACSRALPSGGVVAMAATPDGGGYWMADSSGDVASCGDAADHGSVGGVALAQPIVGMSATPDGGGYWLVARDGGIFSYGDAVFRGSAGAVHLNQPIVGMSATPDGGGYWLVARDGGIFSYGDAVFRGSAGALPLVKPVVGMAPSPDGGGYWLVASDGGIFSYGDARFYGSTGAQRLNCPIVGMAAAPDGAGYWLVASDGGIFTFGDARFFGSAGSLSLARPIVGMTAVPDGGGYRFAASDGGIFTFGDAGFYGSAAG